MHPKSHPSYFQQVLVVICTMLVTSTIEAQQITGRIKDDKGNALSYASIYIKGGSQGTVANNDGYYAMQVTSGSYTLIAAFVGYQKLEKQVTINGTNSVTLDFILNEQQSELREVMIKASAEDPAYAIMRNAIAKRAEYLNEVEAWKSLVYMKGIIRTTQVPDKMFGVKLKPNRDVIDSSGKGIIYFSESLTNYYRQLPGKYKEEVISARLSGNSSGFGFNSPKDVEVNLYETNISITGLNSRGFVSPLHSNAFYFYRFKYDGTYFEDGQEIHRIKLFPRRTYEPLFAGGYIEIMEGSWRIHGVDLYLNKQSQIEIVDSLNIRQQMLPVAGVWMPQSTAMYASIKIFSVEANAQFVANYSNYNFNDSIKTVFADRVIKSIDTAANKRSISYWQSIRPTPLTIEEERDYLKKDTLERKLKSPGYLDSIDRITNKPTFTKIFLRGQSHVNRYNKTIFSLPGLITGIQYNTVEQWNYELSPTFRKYADTGSYLISLRLRYAFGTGHFNASGLYRFTIGKNYNRRFTVSLRGGKNVYQINPDNPITPLSNTSRTLLFTNNDMKIYEKIFGSGGVQHTFKNGLRIGASVAYEDRIPLYNTDTSYTWRRVKGRSFTPNYPKELPAGFFDRHQAFITQYNLRWQPGQQYIDYPNRRYSTGSRWPVLNAQFTTALPKIFGADADFSKWKIGVEDEFNLKLAGQIKYLVEGGGFLNTDNVQLPDWRHFTGNLTIRANPYVSSFQVAPYYAYSTIASFYTNAHLEWHLNGFLSNKIPLFKRFNWFFVTGSNAFYIDNSRYYAELFFGIENIFKTIRVDYVAGYDKLNGMTRQNIVIGFSGLFTGQGVD